MTNHNLRASPTGKAPPSLLVTAMVENLSHAISTASPLQTGHSRPGTGNFSTLLRITSGGLGYCQYALHGTAYQLPHICSMTKATWQRGIPSGFGIMCAGLTPTHSWLFRSLTGMQVMLHPSEAQLMLHLVFWALQLFEVVPCHSNARKDTQLPIYLLASCSTCACIIYAAASSYVLCPSTSNKHLQTNNCN